MKNGLLVLALLNFIVNPHLVYATDGSEIPVPVAVADSARVSSSLGPKLTKYWDVYCGLTQAS